MVVNGTIKLMAHHLFATATPPPTLIRPRLYVLVLLLAALNSGLALAQLASFEDFVLALDGYQLTAATTPALAIVIAGLEILSLPVLLRLRLSPLLRAFSSAAIVLAPLLWCGLAAVAYISDLPLANAGYFGGLLEHAFSGWLLLASLLHLSLSVWALSIVGGTRLAHTKRPRR